jgi:hypothetical protein
MATTTATTTSTPTTTTTTVTLPDLTGLGQIGNFFSGLSKAWDNLLVSVENVDWVGIGLAGIGAVLFLVAITAMLAQQPVVQAGAKAATKAAVTATAG